MGIIKISDVMHANLRATSGALSRSINAQAEHWMRVGMLSELYPSLAYGEICRILIQADADGTGPALVQFEGEHAQRGGVVLNAVNTDSQQRTTESAA